MNEIMANSFSRSHSKPMLAPREIFEITQEISRNYSPLISPKAFPTDKKIALTPKQLLDISHEIARKFSPKINDTCPNLVLLPIDPSHLFASWKLGKPEASPTVNDKTEAPGIVLRIYPKHEKPVDKNASCQWFDFAVKPEQTRQKLAIPKEHKAKSYTGAIGKVDHEKRFTVIAASKVIDAPHRSTAPNLQPSIAGEIQAFSSNQENLPESRYNISSRGIN